jgi:hypothetical protein
VVEEELHGNGREGQKGDLISTRLARESLTKSGIREEEWRIFARKVGIFLIYFIFFGEIMMI